MLGVISNDIHSSTDKQDKKEEFYNSCFTVLDRINSELVANSDQQIRISNCVPLMNGLHIKDFLILPRTIPELRKLLSGNIGDTKIICPATFDSDSPWYDREFSEAIARRMKENGCDDVTATNIMAKFHIPTSLRLAIEKKGSWDALCAYHKPDGRLLVGFQGDSGAHCLTLGPWLKTKEFYEELYAANREVISFKPGKSAEVLRAKLGSLLDKAEDLFTKVSVPFATILRNMSLLSAKEKDPETALRLAKNAVEFAPTRQTRSWLEKLERENSIRIPN